MKARIATIVLVTVLFALAAVTFSGTALGRSPGVLPPNAQPYGQTYGEWAADWWTWALTQPTATNPVLDPTGANCTQGQTGKVWFLAGSFFGGTVNRSCTVPPGTALLFPVVNSFYCALASDPPEQQTEEYVRSQLASVAGATGLSASIDGVSVPDIKGRYFEESPFFTVVLPADNIFGLPEGELLKPCADAGYYLMVHPLSPGTHTIRFAGSIGSFSLDVTYAITVNR